MIIYLNAVLVKQLFLKRLDSVNHTFRIKDFLNSFNNIILGGLLPLVLHPDRSQVLRVLRDFSHQLVNDIDVGAEYLGDMSCWGLFKLDHPDDVYLLN